MGFLDIKFSWSSLLFGFSNSIHPLGYCYTRQINIVSILDVVTYSTKNICILHVSKRGENFRFPCWHSLSLPILFLGMKRHIYQNRACSVIYHYSAKIQCGMRKSEIFKRKGKCVNVYKGLFKEKGLNHLGFLFY